MKRKLLSLLLSAVMLFTLVTPAFADEEPLPDGAAVEEETVGGEVGEETVTEDEGGEVTLFEDEEGGTVPPDAPSGGGAVVGGGGGNYDVDDNDVATFTLYEGFCAAMNDDDVTEVLIEEDHEVTFSSLDETINITKPLTIDGTLRIENAYVMATANVTVNGRLEIYGDYDGHYTEWHMDAPEDYWDDFTEAPDTLDGPKLFNNGEIEMSGLSGIMLSWPCDYEKGEGAKLSGGEFKYADYLNYNGADESNPGLTARYTDDQTTVKTTDSVLRTAFVNTEMGLKTALNRNVYNSSIQVFGNAPVALSTAGEYDAPCTLMTNVPFTVGEGVTLNLAEGTFNQFNNGLTVAGTLNVNTNGNMCFVNDNTQIVPGGTLNNAPGSNLTFNDDVKIFGTLNNDGRMENCNDLIIKQGGELTVNDSDEPITYDPNARNEWGDELGWETAQDHVLFNRDFLTVEEGGTLTVGGALKNDGNLRVFGEMNVLASAAGDNALPGVINGSVKSFGSVLIDGGTLTVGGAYGADATEENIAHPYAAAFVSIGYCRIGDGVEVCLGGMFYQYDSMVIGGSFDMDSGSALYNGGKLTVLDSGDLTQSGYVQNDGEINVSGLYRITPAKSDNTEENDTEDDRSNPDSVLCNNGELIINGGQVQIAGSDEVSSYCAIVHNNNRIKNEGGTLTLGGLLRNFAFIENWSDFTVAESGRIENHNQLRVGDSDSYQGWDYEPIGWADGASAEKNLSDDYQLRLAQMRWDNGEEWLELRPDVYSIKGDEWLDMVIVDGRDYFGGWDDEVEDVTVKMENLCYNGNGDRYEQGELDPVAHIIVSEPDENGRFTLRFAEWGETRVVLTKDERVYRYDAGVCLNNDGGFYYDRDVLCFEDGEIRLDIDKAQEVAVLGNTVDNLGADTALWFVRENGFDWDEINDTWVKIEGKNAEIDGPDDHGWYRVCVEGREYLMLLAAPRDSEYDENRFDILCLLNDDILDPFGFELHVGGSNGYLHCEYKEDRPEVYIENTAVQTAAGSTVTVAVKAKNVGEIGGFDLTVGYDANALTFTGAAVNSAFYSSGVEYRANSGTIRVPSAVCNANNGVDCTEDTLLFTLTFETTRDFGAEDDLHLWFDGGENMLTTLDSTPQKISAARRSGTVEAFIPGDVLRDGKVDIRDAVRLLLASAKLVDDLSAAEREAALLVKNEAEPDVRGVLAILNYLANGAPLAYKGGQ